MRKRPTLRAFVEKAERYGCERKVISMMSARERTEIAYLIRQGDIRRIAPFHT